MPEQRIIEPPKPPTRIIYVDASNQILGRLASKVAKLVKMGYQVYIVNAEKAVMSGDPQMVIHSYLKLLRVKVHVNPYKWGPKRPRNPVNIVKAAIKGMLPKGWRGIKLLKRVKVYIGLPDEFKDKRLVRFPDADATRLARKYIRVEEVAKAMGWAGVRVRQ
ncbi:MAG: 50S ribosomal protein L13 [Pyrodictiaceae archaeon]